jgi:hypothetical protein
VIACLATLAAIVGLGCMVYVLLIGPDIAPPPRVPVIEKAAPADAPPAAPPKRRSKKPAAGRAGRASARKPRTPS